VELQFHADNHSLLDFWCGGAVGSETIRIRGGTGAQRGDAALQANEWFRGRAGVLLKFTRFLRAGPWLDLSLAEYTHVTGRQTWEPSWITGYTSGIWIDKDLREEERTWHLWMTVGATAVLLF